MTFTIDEQEISATDCTRDVMAITKMRFLQRRRAGHPGWSLYAATRCRLMKARGCAPRHRRTLSIPARHALLATSSSRGQPMLTEDDREKRREESPEWHRARAKSLREHGFTKMAEEHEQIAQAIERRRQQEQTK